MDALNHLILAGAGSPLVFLALFLLVAIDGFFPPVPSETAVVALASIGFATGAPNPWLVLLVAAAGSFVGDNLAFTIGRRLGVDRFRFTRGPRTQRMLARMRGTLENRSASLIMTARFVPIGRVAVNVLAGQSGVARRRFVLLSAVSGAAWAIYSVLVGVAAGAWLHEQPVLGAVVAAGAALAVGLLVDRISRIRRRPRVPAAPPAPTPAPAPQAVAPAPQAVAARLALESTGPRL